MRSNVFEEGAMAAHTRVLELMELFRKRHPEVVKKISATDRRLHWLSRAQAGVSMQQGKADSAF